MKFFRYWITDNEEKIDKNSFLAKGVYILFILYFFLLGFVGLITDRTIASLLIVILFPSIMIMLIVGDIFFFYNKKNKFSIRTHNIFQKIVLLIKKQIMESKQKVLPMKAAFGWFAYIFIFFMIPLAFMFLVINGQWQYATTSGSIAGSYGIMEGYHKEIDHGIVNIKPTLEKDYRIKLFKKVPNTLL
jgi:hypothetical protein